MRPYALLFLMLASCLAMKAQTVEPCATPASPAWAQRLQAIVASLGSYRKAADLTPIPCQVHLFKRSDSSSVLSLQQIRGELDSVNSFYATAGIFLYECEPAELIVDDSLYNYDSSTEEPVLLAQHYTPNVLNIYFPNTAAVSGTLVCGYSRYPPSADLAVIAASCATNGSTVAHEIGHYFGLMHTHETFYGAELVDGSNCAYAGDRVCDTPADPGLGYNNVDLSCAYTGTVTDANTMPYAPDVSNIMSYARKECRFRFTPTQYGILNQTMQTERYYLRCLYGLGMEEGSLSGIMIYPNPGQDLLNISAAPAGKPFSFALFDLLGNRLASATVGAEGHRLDSSTLPPGIYFYVLQSQGQRCNGKWIKH